MPTIFSLLDAAYADILRVFAQHEQVDEGHNYSWPNYVFSGPTFRRAHLDVVDARDTKKLFMLHLTVFPHVADPSPIFGFDIIAGPNKVTGAFHDFSPVAPQHALTDWFAARATGFVPTKQRELPEWARAIFSGHMLAAGNVRDAQELQSILSFVLDNLREYLGRIGGTDGHDHTARQNRYCHFQKQNPHTPKVMGSLGLDPAEVAVFIDECLFPELMVK